VPTLSDSQQQAVAMYLTQFGERLRHELSDEGWNRERRERSESYQRVLARESIDSLSEEAFRDVAKALWALRLWTNKDWKVDDVLGKSGIANIRGGLATLLYGEGPIGPRYDHCQGLLRGLGGSSITEILCFMYPQRYPIWNDKPKKVLPLLGMKELVPNRAYRYQLKGKDYEHCILALSLVRDQMRDQGFRDADFLDLDILMWLLFLEVVGRVPSVPGMVSEAPEEYGTSEEVIGAEQLEHWDAMGILLELGNLLGYETYTSDPSRESTVVGRTLGDIASVRDFPAFTYERHLDTARRIDVVWFSEGFPSYCFEVECTTGVTSGLLRLYQVRNFTRAKFFIVSPASILSRYRAQISNDPFYAIRDRYEFRSFDELLEFFDRAKEYYAARDHFLGR